MLFYFACEVAGASAPGIPHALLGRKRLAQLGRIHAARMRRCNLPHREKATRRVASLAVMPGLVPGIHVLACCAKSVDGRDKPGHDDQVCQPGKGENRMRSASRTGSAVHAPSDLIAHQSGKQSDESHLSPSCPGEATKLCFAPTSRASTSLL